MPDNYFDKLDRAYAAEDRFDRDPQNRGSVMPRKHEYVHVGDEGPFDCDRCGQDQNTTAHTNWDRDGIATMTHGEWQDLHGRRAALPRSF